MRIFTLFFGLFLFFQSCQDDSKIETITIKNQYSLDVYTNMSKTNELNDEASLQYQNIFKEIYVVVIDESAEQFNTSIVDNDLVDLYKPNLNGYSKLIIDGFEPEANIKKVSKEKDTLINGLEAKVIEFEGKVNEYKVYYQLAFIKSQKSYYQIMTWTLMENKEKLKNKLDKMTYSFKEIRSKTVAK
ncbi:hypothetical protein [uncultured Flavobacterium sp.]|uniref:hypothetical protein n=1 Tax=uncultured Flavobacterium sp. TaxID=165435 RepID=UPI0030EC7498